MKQNLKIFLTSALLLLSFQNNVSAKEEIFEGYGEHILGSAESQDYAQKKAKEDALRDATQKAGVYFEQNSEVKNGQITKNEIRVIYSSAIAEKDCILESEILQGKTTQTIVYHCHITVGIDTSVVDSQIKYTDRKKLSDAAQLRENLEAELARREAEMNALNEKILTAREEERKIILSAAKKNEQNYDALQLIKQGETCYLKNDYAGAIEALNKALELEPNLAQAYSWLGCVYNDFGNIDKAVEYFNKAIELDADNALAYNGLSVCYHTLGN